MMATITRMIGIIASVKIKTNQKLGQSNYNEQSEQKKKNDDENDKNSQKKSGKSNNNDDKR